jgi:ligand-binding sensor domain-containing protein/signal transduction histidine kinase
MRHFSFNVLIILLLSISISSSANAQEDVQFEHLTTRQGLSVNSVLSAFQDREGYMWFGTEDGLNKYDGYSFTVFKHDPNDSRTLKHNRVKCIYEDRTGRLWIGTWGGLHQLDKRTGKAISYRVQIGNEEADNGANLTLCIYEDRKGLLWLGAYRATISFNPDTKKFTLYPFPRNLPPQIRVNDITEDATGKIWIGSSVGLYQFDPKTKGYTLFHLAVSHAGAEPAVTALFTDSNGILWIGTTGKGIFRMDCKTPLPAISPYKGNGEVNAAISQNGIFEDKKGNLWLATTQGLQQIDRKTNTVFTYRFDASKPGTISSNNIIAIYQDRTGNIWAGTDNGINKLGAYSKPFTVFQFKPASLRRPENEINAALEDKTGDIWVSSPQGLSRFDSALKKLGYYGFNPANLHRQPSIWVQAIYEDRQGRLWAGTQEGLQLFNRATRKFTIYPFRSHNFYRRISEDPSGKLWMGGELGLICFDPIKIQYQYYLQGSFQFGTIASRTGDIWTGITGLLRLRQQEDTVIRFDTPGKEMNNVTILDLYEDHDGSIWIGTTHNGLIRVEPQTKAVASYTTSDGLPTNFIQKIIEDNYGNLWLGTTKGICRFNPKTKSVRNFDESDGLPDGDVISGSPGRNNKLFFGTRNGLVIFYPDSLKNNAEVPPVYISSFKVLDKPMLITSKTIELSHNQNYLSFEFVALNYNSPEKNQYAYRLEGLDKGWVYTNTRRYTSYTNLNPGRYTFRVKARNDSGIWNEQGDSITIYIKPPWWGTRWAYAFYAVCLIAGVFAVDRFQRRRLIQKEREKAKERELQQAREIEKAYHELKTTQTQLIQSEKMASLGELTAGIAHEIQNPLNLVNNFSEVSVELADEMENALQKDDKEEAITIAGEIKDNLQKITHHGKRADVIVKGMLQHSRAISGKKELTDINALTDEYLRLSYHGLRAKDKDFNANFTTNFDESIGKIEVAPQDMGRILLNLYNNAFYSVNEKKKQLNGTFEPSVSVSTKKDGNKVEISVRDNGTGIPKKVVDKIYQPFFTTKPTGQGTGLGLSLSYDIITKGHGGQLKVETKEGEYSTFTVIIPTPGSK